MRVFGLIKSLIKWLGIYAVYLQMNKATGFFTNAVTIGFSYIFYLVFCLYSAEINTWSVMDFFLTRETLF